MIERIGRDLLFQFGKSARPIEPLFANLERRACRRESRERSGGLRYQC